MPAAVEQDADNVVVASDHNERVVADCARDVITRIGNLRLMRQEDPVAAKNPFELEFVKGSIVEKPKRQRAGFDQPLDGSQLLMVRCDRRCGGWDGHDSTAFRHRGGFTTLEIIFS
jgi:hypothetical protein